jgi:2-iminobutanoate/2-iminopropanoate deaminase
MSREVVTTPNAPAAIGPYSQAIVANGFVYVGGQLPLIPGTKDLAGDTVAAQTAQALKNVAAVLEAAGTDMAHAVKVTVLLSEMSSFAEMNEVYKTFFTGEPPARTTFAAKGLPMNVLVEIDAIAVMP